MSLESLWWLLCASSLFVGCWVQTALGFGMAVIAAPIIVIFKPEWVPIVITATALVLSLFNTWDQRLNIELREMRVAFITRIPGTILGAWLLLQLTTAWLQIAVALCVLIAVVISYFGKQFEYTSSRLGLAAFFSGVMGTTTSIGGPPMALVMQHGQSKSVRANLSLYFAYSCFISLIGYALTGLITQEHIIVSLSLLPVAILGFIGGKRSRAYVDAGRFRPLLLGLCSMAGIIALFGALLDQTA